MSNNRIYRTSEGRHVREGDPQAVYLAYGEGDEVPAKVRRELEQPKPKPPKSKS
ncbi:hypothetical protein [Saccharopolyspora mangrovi]|uniref:Uncharacterized protein n=1 Tax=Saccharopolyspora mangrovi TaxID=3082379 RepID=A0ABU6A7E5_9PSEU|nr:hypothetical protein [Saccharopolyspora sp. S2-29]MEB3367414.1 hypothetical protein [Saccharopolyspora sp. S2-29]